MLKRFLIIFFLLTTAIAHAADSPVLLRMAKSDGPRTSRIMLVFSTLPDYRVRVTGQRIDLTLSGAVQSPHLAPLPEDGTVVDVFSGHQGGDLLVSFLLKRAPVRVNAVTANNPASLVLELHWAGTSTPPIPRLLGMPTLQRGPGPTEMGTSSPYAGHWKSFYRNYLVPIRIAAPMHYLRPPFPWPGLGDLPAPALAAARAGDWSKAAAVLVKAAPAAGARRPALLLAAAAADLEDGGAADSSRMLTEVEGLSPDSPLASFQAYLGVCAKAVAGDPYGAAFALSVVPERERRQGGLAPFFNTLEAEVAITTGSIGDGIKVVAEGDAAYPNRLKELRSLRRADLHFASGEREQAYVAYRQLDKSHLFRSHPWSLAAYAETLLAHDQYRNAAARYLQLAQLIAGQPDAALALYASAWSQLAIGDTGAAMQQLSDILSRYPGSDGAFRAKLKINDLMVLGDKGYSGEDALRIYRDVAARAPDLKVREAAAFKSALTASLQGQRSRAIDELDTFLRNFASGRLCVEARARLIELLPPVVTEMLHRKQYVAALALVERNRDLLLADRVGRAFLLNVGEGFGQLGLWGRAVNVYRSVHEMARTPQDQESSYLPLIGALFHQGADADVLKCAARYEERFPQGPDRAKVFLWRVKALLRSDQLETAARLLKGKDRPQSLDLDLLAGRIFWERKDYPAVAHALALAMDRDLQDVPPEDRLLRAEALFLDGNFSAALPLYQQLRDVLALADQAVYRCAQIDLKTGNRAEGLKLLRQLVEKGGRSGWQDMARQTLALETF